MEKASLYVDGACKGNPGPGGWGCYLIYHNKDEDKPDVTWSCYGGKKHTTNNEMELSGFLNGLRLARTGVDITVYADTQYGLKGLLNSSGTSKEYLDGKISKNKLGNDVVFTGWVDKWTKNGWKTQKGDVANKQLWVDIMAECKRHILNGSLLRFIWVKGHSGIPGNEIADDLANLGKTL